MISLDLAPNDGFSDALTSTSLLVQPWRWIRGSQTGKVKTKLKRYFNGHEATLYLSARGALYKLFQALNLKEGDEVIVTGFTCEAVILPITALKLKPKYADIELRSFSLSYASVKSLITKKTKIIILQHTYGSTPHDRTEILELAEKNDVMVVEDLAHGFDHSLFKKDGSTSTKLLSFGRAKALSSVFGGALITPDKVLAEELKKGEKRLLRPKLSFIARCLLYKPMSYLIKKLYHVLYIGKVLHALIEGVRTFPKEVTEGEKRGVFSAEMATAYPNALAALLNHQLKNFEILQNLRRQNVKEYNSAFNSVESVQPLGRYPVLIDQRDAVMKKARKNQIYLSRWYKELVSPAGECPQAEAVKDKILNLPTHTTHKDTQEVLKLVDMHNFNLQHGV